MQSEIRRTPKPIPQPRVIKLAEALAREASRGGQHGKPRSPTSPFKLPTGLEWGQYWKQVVDTRPSIAYLTDYLKKIELASHVRIDVEPSQWLVTWRS